MKTINELNHISCAESGDSCHKLLSVIVPIYKVEAYLNECVDSILAQTYPNIEIILVDDGTPDRSGEMADEYARRFPNKIKVIHKENGGLSSARNAGLDVARGEYVGFVDSDDAVLPEYFADMIEAMDRTGADSAGSAFLPWKSTRKVIPPLRSETIFNGSEALVAFLERRIDSSSCTRIYRRSFIGDTRFIQGITNEDMPFLIELYHRADRVVYLPKGYYLYRVTPGSISNSLRPAFFDVLDNLDRVRPMIDRADDEVRRAFEFFMLYQHIMSGIKIVRNKYNRKYKERLRQNRRVIRRGFKTVLTHRASSPRMVGKAIFCFLHLPVKI